MSSAVIAAAEISESPWRNTGGTLIFPDFAAVHRRDSSRRFLLEIVGYWTQGYLQENLSRLMEMPVPGEFQILPHLRPRVQDELSQSFDFPIFKRGNQIEIGRFKRERVSPTQ